MYYASNIFALYPATPDRALKKLEDWLARIGIENCKFLQKVVITLNKDTGLLVDHLEEDRDPWVSLVAVMKATGCMPHLQLELRLHENMRPPPAVLESMSGLFSDIENDAVRELVEIRRAMAHTRLTSYLQVLQWRERNPDTFHQWESSEIPEFVTMVRQSTNERDCTYNWNKREDTLRPRQDFESDKVDEGLAAFSERFSKLEEFELETGFPLGRLRTSWSHESLNSQRL